MLVDPTTGKATKVARKYLEDGTKVRVSKASGQVIPKPDLLIDRKPRSSVLGLKDTAPADVFAVTFEGYEKYMSYIYNHKGSSK
jgi:large subunit ribosomal protein L24